MDTIDVTSSFTQWEKRQEILSRALSHSYLYFHMSEGKFHFLVYDSIPLFLLSGATFKRQLLCSFVSRE